mmetsp:Transcript_52050/g.151236  ORF Transcript_52050/g.151236 Transcript_52050/m.151236 type:complete len:202 (+) Transcript_52050:338-943(+)
MPNFSLEEACSYTVSPWRLGTTSSHLGCTTHSGTSSMTLSCTNSSTFHMGPTTDATQRLARWCSTTAETEVKGARSTRAPTGCAVRRSGSAATRPGGSSPPASRPPGPCREGLLRDSCCRACRSSARRPISSTARAASFWASSSAARPALRAATRCASAVAVPVPMERPQSTICSGSKQRSSTQYRQAESATVSMLTTEGS